MATHLGILSRPLTLRVGAAVVWNRYERWGSNIPDVALGHLDKRRCPMGMLVTIEFADAGKKTGTRRVLVIGGCRNAAAAGDIGMTLEVSTGADG